MKIAVYCANFGNYRNENNQINNENIIMDKEIDYYFFTDDINMKSNKWKIIYVSLQQKNHMNAYRHTSKYIKFILPSVLENYDAIIWIDSKSLCQLHFSKYKIQNILKNDNFYLIKHPIRETLQQELKETVKYHYEPKGYGENFLEKVKTITYKSQLPDTTIMIYKNTLVNRNILKNVYDLLIENKLCRDQNVFQHAFYLHNAENKINFFSPQELSYMQHHKHEIQLDKTVIRDIFENINENTKILVFGLGYDSKMWYDANKNTYFIENKQEYIDLNKDIPSKNIIKYDYKDINVNNSDKLTNNQIENFPLPNNITNIGKFDIIIIDGPEGWHGEAPGRLLPCYWATKLIKKSGIIYVDDSSRKLENYCVQIFFNNKTKYIFKERLETTKIIW